MENNRFIDLNPWRFELKIPLQSTYKRFIFDNIIKLLNEPLIVALQGPRRLGKTTLVKQTIEHLISQNVNALNIYFYTLTTTDNNLQEMLETTIDTKTNETIYVFIDEIQYYDNWQDLIKTWFDNNKNIHFLVTGSTSIFQNKSKETLLGRIISLNLPFLSFREYLALKYKTHIGPFDFNNKQLLPLHILQNEKTFYEYLEFGDITALIDIQDQFAKKTFVESSFLDIFFEKDLLTYSIEKPAQMRILYKSLAQNTAQVINKKNIASEIGLSRPVVNKYIQILALNQFIKIIPNFYKSVRKQENSSKKIYLSSTNTVFSVLNLNQFENIPFVDFKGHIIENATFNQLTAYSNNISYWARNSLEVDFVVEINSRIYPLEVKSTRNKDNIKLNNILTAMQEFEANTGFIVYSGEPFIQKIDNKNICFINPWSL